MNSRFPQQAPYPFHQQPGFIAISRQIKSRLQLAEFFQAEQSLCINSRRKTHFQHSVIAGKFSFPRHGPVKKMSKWIKVENTPKAGHADIDQVIISSDMKKFMNENGFHLQRG